MNDLRDKIVELCCEALAGPPLFHIDEKLADAILALPEIADLQKRLAEVTAERDVSRSEVYHSSVYAKANSEKAEAAEARFIEQRDSLVSVTKKLAKTEAKLAEEYHKGFDDGCFHIKEDYQAGEQLELEAAIPRAYQMGLDAAAVYVEKSDDGSLSYQVARSIRALTPPADLVEQCKKETALQTLADLGQEYDHE